MFELLKDRIKVQRGIRIDKGASHFFHEIISKEDILKIEKSGDNYMNKDEYIIVLKSGDQICVNINPSEFNNK